MKPSYYTVHTHVTARNFSCQLMKSSYISCYNMKLLMLYDEALVLHETDHAFAYSMFRIYGKYAFYMLAVVVNLKLDKLKQVPTILNSF
jgi:hypothetical protein